MNVTTDDIKAIKSGTLEVFICSSAAKVRSACSLVANVKNTSLPEGVVDYETRKCLERKYEGVNLVIIRALGQGDEKILNRTGNK